MRLLEPLDAATPFEALLAHRPQLLERYRSFCISLWNDARVPRRTMELCRLRVAAIHGCRQEWALRDAAVALDAGELVDLEQGRFERFNADERAALVIAERMPYGHHQLEDAEVAALRHALGAPGAVALLTAIAFFDAGCRLKLVLEVPGTAIKLFAAPLSSAALA